MRSHVFALLLVASCGATAEGVRFGAAPPPAAPDTAPPRASSPEVGVVVILGDAMAELSLEGAQRDRLVALLDGIKRDHRRSLDARAMMAIDMSRSVESALIDEKLLSLDAQNLGAARAAVAAADGKTLEELHRLLSPEQRKRFAASLSAKADKLRTDDLQSRLGVWRHDLEVTAEQEAKIAPKLEADTASAASARAEREAWRERLKKTAAEFERDAFTAAPYLDPDVEKTTVARIQRVIAFLKVVVPELTQPQLDRAGQIIRAEAGVTHHAERD